MADWNKIVNEITFSTSRSSGAGGQHVNKVETKVRACFSIEVSDGLSPQEKEILKEKLSKKIDKDHCLCISVQESRSQAANKELALEKIISLIQLALIPVKKRKSTKVPKAEKLKRLEQKKARSKTKDLRKRPDL